MLARRCGIAALQLNPISTAKNPFSLWLSATDITGIFLRKPSENCPTLPRTCVLMMTSVSALGFKRDNLNQLVCPRCFVRQQHWFPVIPVTEVWLQQWHWFHSLEQGQLWQNMSVTFLLPSQWVLMAQTVQHHFWHKPGHLAFSSDKTKFGLQEK